MGGHLKTAEKKASNPLNAPNAPFGNPMQMQQNAEDQRLNNVMMLNQEMQEGEEHRENAMNPQAQQEQEAKVEVKEVIKSPAQLMEELEKLDNYFSVLGEKQQAKIKSVKGESLENANFVARYQSRNDLVKKMHRAVRLAKTKINDANQNLDEEELKKLNTMVKEAETAKTQIRAEDTGLKNWEIYSENNEAMDGVMDEIIADSGLTDSGVYKDVVKAIKRYRKDKSQKNFSKLQEKVEKYIKKRTDNYTKGEEKFRPKGRARIRRMKDLAARLGIYEQQKAYKKRAAMTEASKIQYKGTAADDMIDYSTEKLKNASERMQEAFAIESKFDGLKVASKIIITARMLEPEYIMGHLDEMKQNAKCIKDALDFIEKRKNKQNQNQEGGVKSQEEIFEEKIYRHYALNINLNQKIFGKLGDYITACELGNQNQIEELRETMDSCGGMLEESEEMCKEFYEDMDARMIAALRMAYVVGAYGETKYGATLSADKDRLGRVLEGFQLNEQGRFASEKDREIFEKNLVMMDTMYNGEPEQFLELVEKYMAEDKTLPMDETITTKEYMEEHFMELSNIASWDLMRANLKDLRPDVCEMIEKKYGKDYIKTLNAEDGGFGAAMSTALKFLAVLKGFSYNSVSFYSAGLMEDENERAETERNFEEQRTKMLKIIEAHKKAQEGIK